MKSTPAKSATQPDIQGMTAKPITGMNCRIDFINLLLPGKKIAATRLERHESTNAAYQLPVSGLVRFRRSIFHCA